MKYHHIAVDGPIGVGKSSFTEALCDKLDAAKVLEDIENPFLESFYADQNGAGFRTQLFFLLNRYHQQQELLQQDLFKHPVICDYLFAKDKIFAYLNLDDSDLLLYEKLYSLLAPKVPQPELVIYLQAETEILLKRIRKRQRGFERNISLEYVKEVNRAYDHFFFHYTASPLLVINTSEIDFVERSEDLDELVEQIRSMGSGTVYYRPLGSTK